MKRFKVLFLAVALLLVGCRGNEDDEDIVITTEPVEEGGYRTVYPFEAGDAREVHTVMNLGTNDIMAAGKGLERYSKDYFSTDSYYLQDGQLLNRDRLMMGYRDGDTEGLLNRNSEENPYGLNPRNGSTIPVGKSSIKVGANTIPVVDILEYDFVQESSQNADIKGISVAILLNSKIQDENGKEYMLEDKDIRLIGEEAGRRLVDYLKTLPEVGANTPVMVGIFALNNTDSSLGGRYLSIGYGTQSIDSFSDVDESWVILPSTDAQTLDPQTSTQFNSLKSSLQNVLPNDISVIGRGFYIDKRLKNLQITIDTTGKTYVENLSVVQLMAELIENFDGEGYSLNVIINSNIKTFAMLQKSVGSSEVVTIME